MVKDSQEEDNVKFAHRLRGKICGIDLPRVYLKAKCGPGDIKCLSTMNIGMRPTVRIGGKHSARATPLRFKAEKAVPGANIEYAATAQIDAIKNEGRLIVAQRRGFIARGHD